MTLKIEMLRTFCTVAQCGTLAEAAARLGRTQSAVSMTLKQMEDHLNHKLFEGERKNQLTHLGQQIFDIARLQVKQFDQSIDAIERSAQAPQGYIRIVSVPSVAGVILPTAINQTLNDCPGLNIDLRDADSAQVIDSLMNGHADIGILSGSHSLRNMRQVTLFSDSYGVVCRPDHALAMADTITLNDIYSHGVIWNALCDRIDTPDVKYLRDNSRLSIHNTLSLLAYVRQKNGVTILPRTAADLFLSGLVFLPITDLPEQRTVQMLYPQKPSFPEFLDHLVKHICATALNA